MKKHLKLASLIITFGILGGLWVFYFTDQVSEAMFQWPTGVFLGACLGFILGWTQPSDGKN